MGSLGVLMIRSLPIRVPRFSLSRVSDEKGPLHFNQKRVRGSLLNEAFTEPETLPKSATCGKRRKAIQCLWA